MSRLAKPAMAICQDCGHIGRSKLPKYYRCTACDNEARARFLRNQAEELRAQADEHSRQAEVRDGIAAAFRRKHGTSSPAGGRR